MKKIGLLPKLILGILAGIVIGLISASAGQLALVRLMSTFSAIFGNFLSFMIPCIIIGFVAPGIADLGKQAGKTLGITALIAYCSAVAAGFVAFFVGKAILPGVISMGELSMETSVNVSPLFSIEMGQIMGVMTALIFAFLLGIGMSTLQSNKLLAVTKDFQALMAKTVKHVLIPLIPIHIAGVFAKLSAAGQIFQTIAAFASVFALIIILQLLYVGVQYCIAWSVSGKKPVTAIKNMLPAYFTALGTQSSAATIAVTLDCARKNNVSDDIVDFVIPLGATIHLAGDTITLVLASMGVMLLFGQTPTLALMAPFIFMLGITMVAAPGIPGGGVMAALGLMSSMLGFAQPQLDLMIALHFAQDSFGTATNVTGDGAIAIIIDSLFGQKLKLAASARNKKTA